MFASSSSSGYVLVTGGSLVVDSGWVSDVPGAVDVAGGLVEVCPPGVEDPGSAGVVDDGAGFPPQAERASKADATREKRILFFMCNSPCL